MVNERDLAQSACRIFGHQWNRTRYRACTDPSTGRLVIRKARTCKRCKEVQEQQK